MKNLQFKIENVLDEALSIHVSDYYKILPLLIISHKDISIRFGEFLIESSSIEHLKDKNTEELFDVFVKERL